MKIVILLFFVFAGFQVMAHREYAKLDPIELNKKDYRPTVRNIEASPYFQRCFTRLESKSFMFRTPRNTERFTLEQCVNFEEKFNGIR
ncbi:MAG: hypothetical protein Q8L85_09340 [Alphaproteobacteria bacterium]|nr:hypothetical protein [Alphaproteobacteria bacterium]MDP3533658.1 hypothetical protein [Alphaproteobacteria bacterium]